jgi:hypothetical protein
MTPLAHRLARTLTQSPKDDQAGIKFVRGALTNAHFFEVTEVIPLADSVVQIIDKNVKAGEPFTPCTFLPAPNTWLEYRNTEGWRRAFSLRHRPADNFAEVTTFTEMKDGGGVYIGEVGEINLATTQLFLNTAHIEKYKNEEAANGAVWSAVTMLAIINSPRIVGRRTHTPHKGLARELVRAGGPGIGPLHDWHEIRLEITKPRDINDGEPHEDVITGKRALHFCRKHLRMCHSGVLAYVREHWRGDAALGIRRGRYVAVA